MSQQIRRVMEIERVSDRGFNSAVILDDPADVSCTSASRVAPSKRTVLLVRNLSEYLSVPPIRDPIEQQKA